MYIAIRISHTDLKGVMQTKVRLCPNKESLALISLTEVTLLFKEPVDFITGARAV